MMERGVVGVGECGMGWYRCVGENQTYNSNVVRENLKINTRRGAQNILDLRASFDKTPIFTGIVGGEVPTLSNLASKLRS
jgi:hypothetical protein